MRKKIKILVMCTIVFIIIGGLSSTFCNESKDTVLVSNLTDQESRQELQDVLNQAGIVQERQRVFWEHVDQFNDCVGREKLISGFQELEYKQSHFDEYELQNIWTEKYPDFLGYNCRLTAFGLMGDRIQICDKKQVDERNSFLDQEALSEDDSVLVDEGDDEKFKALFSTIEGKNTSNQEDQISCVEEEWTKRGITVEDSKVSLITLYMHVHYDDLDNEIFVGHTGVLIALSDSELYFVEKLAFQAPYRMIKLDTKEQLKNYLLERYKDYQGTADAEAFVMENGIKIP